MSKFTKEFKEKAIRLKARGIHPNDIFKDAGINISDKQKDYAGKLISRWRKEIPLSKERDIRKEMEYLKIQIEYLKAENDFLKQLPKKK